MLKTKAIIAEPNVMTVRKTCTTDLGDRCFTRDTEFGSARAFRKRAAAPSAEGAPTAVASDILPRYLTQLAQLVLALGILSLLH